MQSWRDNIRVHVIGERLFPTRIQCDAVDYRYAGQEGYVRTMVPTALPEDVSINCIRLTGELGLTMAGIDLKETPEGEYYCFEVNASPAFPFYESPAGQSLLTLWLSFLLRKADFAQFFETGRFDFISTDRDHLQSIRCGGPTNIASQRGDDPQTT